MRVSVGRDAATRKRRTTVVAVCEFCAFLDDLRDVGTVLPCRLAAVLCLMHVSVLTGLFLQAMTTARAAMTLKTLSNRCLDTQHCIFVSSSIHRHQLMSMRLLNSAAFCHKPAGQCGGCSQVYGFPTAAER